MKNFKLIIPGIISTNALFETMDEAEREAKALLRRKTVHYRFIWLLFKEKLLTIIIKPGYELKNFTTFKYLDDIGKISDYFIINQNGKENYYIKIKK